MKTNFRAKNIFDEPGFEAIGDGKVKLRFFVTSDAKKIFYAARGLIANENGGLSLSEAIANSQALELISADFLGHVEEKNYFSRHRGLGLPGEIITCVCGIDVAQIYFLARATLVKDHKWFFDKALGNGQVLTYLASEFILNRIGLTLSIRAAKISQEALFGMTDRNLEISA